MQLDAHCLSAVVVGLSGIMPPGNVYIAVPQNIGYKINITCLPVQLGTKSRSELMRGYFFQRSCYGSIFFDQILHRSHVQALILHR